MDDFKRADEWQSRLREDNSDMMSVGYLIVPILACIVLSLMGHGCSAIGYGVGTAIDNRGRLRGYEAVELQPGEEKVLKLRDGTKIRGNFQGLDSIPIDEYNKTYSQGLTDKWRLPKPGDQIWLTDREKSSRPCELRYFDYAYGQKSLDSIKIVQSRSFVLGCRGTANDSSSEINFDKIKSMTVGSEKHRGYDLIWLASNGFLPLKTRLLMATQDSIVSVPIQRIDRIDQPRRKYGRWIGLGTGVVIDAAVTALIIYAVSEFNQSLLQ